MTAPAETAKAPSISFEFFPPQSPKATEQLWRSVERLAPLNPRYVSVTYGAGGSTRERTMNAIQAIMDRAHLTVAGHLTCVGATREETLDVARTYARMGVRRIVALRGDPPAGAEKFEPHPEGYASAAELVAGLREAVNLQIAVAAYPETHPEALSPEADIENLKRKIDAGADKAITQFFFDNEAFYRFRDKCEKAGIEAPIVPGILPIENFAKMRNFAARCGATVPDWLAELYVKAETQEDADSLSVEVAEKQCQDLWAQGCEHIHFYTLNKPDLCYTVCRSLGVEPMGEGISAAAG